MLYDDDNDEEEEEEEEDNNNNNNGFLIALLNHLLAASTEEKTIVDAINKQTVEVKRQLEEVENLLDRIVTEIECTTGR